jgi:hypothetical protein
MVDAAFTRKAVDALITVDGRLPGIHQARFRDARKFGIDTGFSSRTRFAPAIRRRQGLAGRVHDDERDG